MPKHNCKGENCDLTFSKISKTCTQSENFMTPATLVFSWVATQSRPHTNAIPDKKKRERKRMPEVKTGLAS